MAEFYNIRVSSPDFSHLDDLCQLNTVEGQAYVFWDEERRQVYIQYKGAYYLQPNAQIRTSLSSLFGCANNYLTIRQLLVRDGSVRAADTQMTDDFLECEWSDYGMDRIRCEVNIAFAPTVEERSRQLLAIQMGAYPPCVCSCGGNEIPQSMCYTNNTCIPSSENNQMIQ